MNKDTTLLTQSDTSLHDTNAAVSILTQKNANIQQNNQNNNKIVSITTNTNTPLETTSISADDNNIISTEITNSSISISTDLETTNPEYASCVCLTPHTDDEGSALDLGTDTMLVTQLLSSYTDIAEDTLFANHGYKKLKIITDTLQGKLYKAQKLDDNKTSDNVNQYVAIKKCNKLLLKEGIAIQDEINFVVSENIIKESVILKYLTFDNCPIGEYIIKFIDFFESNDDYYLVMEYVESEMNLKQLMYKAFEYINSNKMDYKEYQKVIKYIFWQLTVTVRWLHHDMNC